MRLRCFFIITFLLVALVKSSAQLGCKYSEPMNKVIKINVDDETTAGTAGPTFSITFNSPDSQVYAIAAGEVSLVKNVEDILVIIIKNNDTNYVYSNVKKSDLKAGDKIAQGQVIGYADYDYVDAYYVLDLILVKGQETLLLKKKNFIPRG